MFHNLIKEIWNTTPGLENVLLSGIDGIVIARYHENEADEILVAEAANLIKESQRFGGELDTGALRCLVMQYEELIVVIQMVTEEYFLIGLLKDPKDLATVRYRFTMMSYEWYSMIA